MRIPAETFAVRTQLPRRSRPRNPFSHRRGTQYMSVTLAVNRKVRHDYEILETLEAGIALTGTEVKSCRQRNISLSDAYARLRNGELWLVGMHIAPYSQGNRNNHPPRRDRKLLVHKRELRRLAEAVEARGLTVVPMRVYLTSRSLVKVELAVCRGKKLHDRREAMKRRIHTLEAERAIAARKS